MHLYVPRYEKYDKSKEYIDPNSIKQGSDNSNTSLPHLFRPHSHRHAQPDRSSREYMWDRPPVPLLPVSQRFFYFL